MKGLVTAFSDKELRAATGAEDRATPLDYPAHISRPKMAELSAD
jgi:hypothetical protein